MSTALQVSGAVRAAMPLLLVSVLTAVPAAATDTVRSGAVPDGEFHWPLSGHPAVVREFDPPPHPYGRGHRGVDLAGQPGQPVFAAGSGTVVFAGPLAGRGVISIAHPTGLRTTYEPVDAIVHVGQWATVGQQIGTLAPGHPECAEPACLHWGLRRDGIYLNPLWLVAPGPLRLLPWDGRTAGG